MTKWWDSEACPCVVSAEIHKAGKQGIGWRLTLDSVEGAIVFPVVQIPSAAGVKAQR
jgi:hypothetical protein